MPFEKKISLSFIFFISFSIIVHAQKNGYGQEQANNTFYRTEKMETDSVDNYNYLWLANHPASSGVPLGGIGVGNIEFAPDGRFVRIGINNIHEPIKESTACFFSLWYQNKKGKGAIRLVKDESLQWGMKGVDTTFYQGLFPQVKMGFDNASTPGLSVGINAYSSLVPRDIKNSSLPIVYFDVKLHAQNEGDYAIAFSMEDFIGRDIKDPESIKGMSGQVDMSIDDGTRWPNIKLNNTFAEGYNRSNLKGVLQYSPHALIHKRATEQNYNTQVAILAEKDKGVKITILPSYDIGNSDNAWPDFEENGSFLSRSQSKALLSSPGNYRGASVISAKTRLKAGESKTLHFMLVWYAPAYDIYRKTASRESYWAGGADYNKYYHNFFNSSEGLIQYGYQHRTQNLKKTVAWQKPIMESTLPDWYKFKLINSAYIMYTNLILNKKGDMGVNEGAMGGIVGTMDQQISAHPFYLKFFPKLFKSEMSIFGDGAQDDGRITHFIGNYYYGIGTVGGRNPTQGSWMIDNTGGWIIQLAEYYQQTGDINYLRKWLPTVYEGMKFLKTLMPKGVQIPVGPTTYDDHEHPPIYSYGASIYLATLKAAHAIATDIINAMDTTNNSPSFDNLFAAPITGGTPSDLALSKKKQEEFARQFKLSQKDFINMLWNGRFFAYGADIDGSHRLDNILFTGQLGGQFVSRYCGWGDILPMNIVKASVISQFKISLSKSPDYFADKLWDISKGKGVDNPGSRCWPFYLEDYTGYAAYQAGFYDATFTLMKHIQLVNLRKGLTWSLNLWNPGDITYMTAPVTWFSTDVLASAGIDVPKAALRLAPMIKSNQKKVVYPLFYPHFWAQVVIYPQQKKLLYKIIKTFDDSTVTIRKIISEHPGVSSQNKQSFKIPEFKVLKGRTLDLSQFYDQIVTDAKDQPILKHPDQYEFKYVSPSQINLENVNINQ